MKWISNIIVELKCQRKPTLCKVQKLEKKLQWLKNMQLRIKRKKKTEASKSLDKMTSFSLMEQKGVVIGYINAQGFSQPLQH